MQLHSYCTLMQGLIQGFKKGRGWMLKELQLAKIVPNYLDIAVESVYAQNKQTLKSFNINDLMIL